MSPSSQPMRETVTVAPAPSPARPLDIATIERTAAHLQRFAETLPDEQRSALAGLLERARRADPFGALAARPATEVLTPREVAYFEQLRAEPGPAAPGPRRSLVVILKATRLCNLRCTYCHSWRDGPNQIMSFPVLARTIRDALRDPGVRAVEFVWHGGEVTLLPPTWYRKALWLQEQFRRADQRVSNAVQTNGTNLSDEWIEFLLRYRVSVGVSLDGPPAVHDRRRVDRMGRPTSAEVRRSIERLRDAGVEQSGVLMVIDDEICQIGAERVLEYVLELGVPGVGLLNVIPENTPAGSEQRGHYLGFSRYTTFLSDLFRLWWPTFTDRVVFRELADLVGLLRGGPAQMCVFAGDCFGQYLTVEPAGEISVCDKYIDDDRYRFGNILTLNLADVQRSPRLAEIRAENNAALARQEQCPWFSVCHGGCPHDRYTAERRLGDQDARCCGLAGLLTEMAAALGHDGRSGRRGRAVPATA